MPDTIEKQARIFRTGTYAGKGPGGSDFTVTVADLERIAAGTTEAAAIHAHDETNERLDYGTVDRLEIRGNELWGTLNLFRDAIPFLERNGLKSLSAGIPFDKSKLAHLGFTRRPTIADAAMFTRQEPEIAFFSLADEPEPDVNDALDLLATFAGKTLSSASSAKIKAAHDALATLDPDSCPGMSRYSQSEEIADERKPKMTFWNKLFGKDLPTDAEKAEFHEAIKEALPPAPPPPADTTAQFAQMQKRIEAQDAELFANRMLQSGRILPTQVGTVVAEFSEAAEDDRLAPRIVTFSIGEEGKQGSRVDRVKAKYESAQPHRLTDELLPDGQYAALFNRETSGQTKEQKEAAQEAEYRAARAQTSLGPVKKN